MTMLLLEEFPKSYTWINYLIKLRLNYEVTSSYQRDFWCSAFIVVQLLPFWKLFQMSKNNHWNNSPHFEMRSCDLITTKLYPSNDASDLITAFWKLLVCFFLLNLKQMDVFFSRSNILLALS